MSKPHKHAELIKQWADGAYIEFFNNKKLEWEDVANPNWYDRIEYRIKPEPVEDIVQDFEAYSCGNLKLTITSGDPNLRLTFDGETKQLKKAEVI